jgi:NAD(P)-dependent dehydrogenase (short-subunit alcohol dehydrogenase family)
MDNPYNFSGKVALVAGASKGIGAATAKAFAEAGAAVVLAARTADALAAIAAEIEAAGGRALAAPMDVGDDDAQRRLVEQALDTFGRLDFAFNNATGGPRMQPLHEIGAAAFDVGIRTDIRGTFLGMKYQIPAMLRTGGGAVVNMASRAGVEAVANMAVYVAGKAAIIGLTKAAALDYADHGVRVNVVAPGSILSWQLERAGPEAQQAAARAVPMRRVGRLDEVAATVLWLCSSAAGFITGAVIPIDGGQGAGTKPERMFQPGKGTQAKG